MCTVSASKLFGFENVLVVFTPSARSPTDAMPPVKGAKPGTHTHAALQEKAAAKAAHQAQLDQAVALIADGKGGPDKVAKMVEGCSVRQVKYALSKSLSKRPWRPAWAILTKVEMQRLVKWVLASASNDNPSTEAEVSEQVTKMLQCRRLAWRKAHTQKTSIVPLSAAEERLALEGGNLSHTWFQGFYARNPECQLKTAHKQLIYPDPKPFLQKGVADIPAFHLESERLPPHVVAEVGLRVRVGGG